MAIGGLSAHGVYLLVVLITVTPSATRDRSVRGRKRFRNLPLSKTKDRARFFFLHSVAVDRLK